MNEKTTKPSLNEEQRSEKKGTNWPMIIIGVILGIIVLCGCGFFGFTFLVSTMLSQESVQDSIQKQIEQSIEDEAKKQGIDVDISTNLDKNKTQPLPADFPADVAKVIPSSWGNPYNVSKSKQDDQAQYFALYFVKNRTEAAGIADIESTLRRDKWNIDKNTDPDTGFTVVTGNKSIGGKQYTANVVFNPDGSDLNLTLVVTY
jgi:hypothetical protein